MRRLPTRLEGPILLAPDVHGDGRGFFAETYRAAEWVEHGIEEEWVQDNQSRSRRGTLRGMHFQTSPGQAKLVRCARGRILDVVVDIRPESAAFGHWESCVLDDERLHQLYIPVGFAHGFCVLSDTADVVYKCSSYYDSRSEAGFAYDDPEVGIEWPDLEPIVSDRDRLAPSLRSAAARLPAVDAPLRGR
jgi:dTDP-4-dehydrorhamnose 3,5-epimerase